MCATYAQEIPTKVNRITSVISDSTRPRWDSMEKAIHRCGRTRIDVSDNQSVCT